MFDFDVLDWPLIWSHCCYLDEWGCGVYDWHDGSAVSLLNQQRSTRSRDTTICESRDEFIADTKQGDMLMCCLSKESRLLSFAMVLLNFVLFKN